MIFFKNPASVIAADEPIVIPRVCAEHGPQVDWEAELAVELGRDSKNLDVDAVFDHVAGYRIANDVTARWWQKHGSGGQFCRGKSFDTFCPLGPLHPTREIPDPQELGIRTRLNGELVQSSNTREMLFSVAELLVELTRGTTLAAGTILLTGTPAGVGAGMTPPRFLRDGDVVEIEIDGLGTLRNPVVEA